MALNEKKFHFDRTFQVGILALMTQSYEFLLTATNLIQPQYFEEPPLVWTFQAITNYFKDYEVRPTRLVLENELVKATRAGRVKEPDVPAYHAVLERLTDAVDAQQYIIGEVVRFCRRQEVRKAMLELAPLTESEDDDVWEKIESRISAACNTGAFAVDIGTQYFLQYKERLKKRMLGEEQLIIPTGITDLDYRIAGGLKAGQLGVWMGGTGIGKSIALPHCGKRAIVGGWKVVHYTLELNEDDIAERYDAAWTGVDVYDLRDQTAAVTRKMENLSFRYGNSLIIKDYPTGSATVNTLRQHLLSLKNMSFIPDMVVVDYGDLLKPLTNYNDEYADLGGIFRDLRGLAGEMKVPLWTATQINRPGMSQEVADVDSIADSFKKAQIADLVIAICANRDELDMNILRLFLAKNRNGKSKGQVKIRSSYSNMCFYQPGAPLPAEPTATAPPPSLPPPRRRAARPNGA